MSDKRKKFKTSRKKSKDSSSSSDGSRSSSSGEETDVGDLKPIKEYMSDRREMARQLFLSVKPEKIRMMLPQHLKKIEFSELVEWCATELSGMSKSRIAAILNGQKMLESSETDDSGPSLEIISDTEEWGDLSDLDAQPNDASRPSVKAKGFKEKGKAKAKPVRNDAHGKPKTKHRPSIKIEGDSRRGDETRIKKENEEPKEKDGESLLDLLELEMRARAIRALIRKEEDIIPTTATTSTTPKTGIVGGNSKEPTTQLTVESRNRTMKVVRDKLQEMDTNLAKSTVDGSEEEDVVLVVQPTTTIELLSSESEDEGQSRRVNQRLQNERRNNGTPSGGTVTETGKERAEDVAAKPSAPTERSDGNDHQVPTPTDEESSKKSVELETFKKFKRKSRPKNNEVPKLKKSKEIEAAEHDLKLAKNPNEESTVVKNNANETPNVDEATGIEDNDAIRDASNGTEIEQPIAIRVAEVAGTTKIISKSESVAPEDDKSGDVELIINLDDYPDDMDDPEPKRPANSNSSPKPNSSKPETAEGTQHETWATRYYQTDDVQNVIKESKIQSEIRKRLRERQRLARLKVVAPSNDSTKVVPAKESKIDSDKIEPPKTTGSVEEYLALKQAPIAEQNSAQSSEIASANEEETPNSSKIETAKPNSSDETNETSANGSGESAKSLVTDGTITDR